VSTSYKKIHISFLQKQLADVYGPAPALASSRPALPSPRSSYSIRKERSRGRSPSNAEELPTRNHERSRSIPNQSRRGSPSIAAEIPVRNHDHHPHRSRRKKRDRTRVGNNTSSEEGTRKKGIDENHAHRRSAWARKEWWLNTVGFANGGATDASTANDQDTEDDSDLGGWSDASGAAMRSFSQRKKRQGKRREKVRKAKDSTQVIHPPLCFVRKAFRSTCDVICSTCGISGREDPRAQKTKGNLAVVVSIGGNHGLILRVPSLKRRI
jgi:hypothetical protein